MILGYEKDPSLNGTVENSSTAGGYWVAYSGRLYKVAPQHLRSATREERLSDAVMNQVVREMRANLSGGEGQQQLRFTDLTRQAEDLRETCGSIAVDLLQAPVEVPVVTGDRAEPEGEVTPSPGSPAATPERRARSTSDDDRIEEHVGEPAESREAEDVPVPDDDAEDVYLLRLKPTRAGSKGK